MPLPPVFDRSTQAPARTPTARRGFFEPGTSRILRAVGAGLNPQLLPLQQKVLQQEQERVRQQQEQEQKGREFQIKILTDVLPKITDTNVRNEVMDKLRGFGVDLPDIPAPSPKVPFGRTAEGGVKPEFLAGEQALSEVKRAPTKPGALVTLSTDRGPVTLRQSDPRVDQLISQGATKIRVSGTPEQAGITKKTRGTLEDKIITSSDALSRLDSAMQNFRPEFLELPTQFKGKSLALAEKAGIELSPENQQLLGDLAEFQRDAFENLNRTIKEMTGAQMSEAETKRLRRQVPDPQKDSPTQFVRKTKGTVKSLKMAQARARFFLSQGVRKSGKDLEKLMSLSEMENRIERRGEELEKQGVSEAEIIQTLKQEFGL